jgi:hypothetical protein
MSEVANATLSRVQKAVGLRAWASIHTTHQSTKSHFFGH